MSSESLGAQEARDDSTSVGRFGKVGASTGRVGEGEEALWHRPSFNYKL